MKATITNCSLLLFFYFVCFSALSFGQKPTYIQDQLLVDISNPESLASTRDFQKSIGATIISENKNTGMELWKISSFPIVIEDENESQTLFNIIDILNHTYGEKPSVNNISLNYIMDVPADLSDILDFFELEAYTPAVNCPRSILSVPYVQWATTPKIGIIDSGVDAPVLNNLFEAYTIHMPFANNFVDSIALPPIDRHGHGTQLTGLMMGTLTSWGLPAAEFFPYKIIDHNGQGTLFGLLQAIYAAIDQQVDLLNMSIGFYPHPNDLNSGELIEKAMLALEQADILAVIAAGNDALSLDEVTFYPASAQHGKKVVVAASDCIDSLAEFSNFGASTVELAAPGTDILCPTLQGYWVLANGSSYSAAIVSSIAAALYGIGPYAAADQVRCSLAGGVLQLPSLSGLLLSEGVIHAPGALELYLSDACTTSSPNTLINSAPGETITAPTSANVTFFPNPTHGSAILNLYSPKKQDALFYIFDVTGRAVRSIRTPLTKGRNEILFELADLRPGIYYLSGNNVDHIKIVRQ